MFQKILIANRAEIACRVIRTASKLGVITVAIYAEDDQHSLHVSQADESHSLGSGKLSDTYLNIEKIIQIARESGAQAIHPGYGFLSENAAFVAACEAAGITFIGPTSEAIRLMGNKIAARNFAREAGVPVTEGFTGDKEAILKKSASLPYPLLVKAAAGGGGKGMRIVREAAELKSALESTSREAASYFGDGSVYIEQFLDSPRHIEVQVLGDQHGNAVHVYERECSLQRRYQKIIEEAPSPTLGDEVRQEIGAAAVRLTKAIPYTNAGTIEFLLDQQQKFYFLEMNTRIQVEHPVTEMTTGVDLVAEQLHIAAGHPLRLKQEEIRQRGHAIECRIYAESPENNFLPSPGDIHYYQAPQGNDIRIDSYINGPARIESSYDPMISKLIVYGTGREQARKKMISALQQYAIHGIDTNIAYLMALLKQEAFIKNEISTKFCDQHTPEILETMQSEKNAFPRLPIICAALLHSFEQSRQSASNPVWNELGYWRMLPELTFEIDEKEGKVEIRQLSQQLYEISYQQKSYQLKQISQEAGKVVFELDGQKHTAFVSENEDKTQNVSLEGYNFHLRRLDILSESSLRLDES
ncbi:MAG: acetyl/propionyl/methylcrotonyl-CoA carboxylase subunit alpha, partial [Cyclobacteriaceae bacterium]